MFWKNLQNLMRERLAQNIFGRKWRFESTCFHTVPISVMDRITLTCIFIHCLSFSMRKFWIWMVLMLFAKYSILVYFFCHCFADASRHGRGLTRKWQWNGIIMNHHKMSWNQWRRNIKNDEQINASMIPVFQARIFFPYRVRNAFFVLSL